MLRDFDALMANGKSISGLTPEFEDCLKEIAPIIIPHLPQVTEAFYLGLIATPNSNNFLNDHIPQLGRLKETHLNWLNSLFTQDIDSQFTERMVKVSDTHVIIKLPLELMVGAMFLISRELIGIVVSEFGGNSRRCIQAMQAVNAVLGFSLVIMQQSYKLWD